MNNAVKEFERIDEISRFCTKKVLDAFAAERVSEAHLNGSTGYGYTDPGREVLDRIFARAFECEDALVRPQFVSGTHVLTVALFGMLRTGDTMLSITGKPYDTLYDVVGINEGVGSLKEYGIAYKETDFIDGKFDYDAIAKELKDDSVKLVFIQKSKGYLDRCTLNSEQIGKICEYVKSIRPDVYVMVDNCYGEFCEKHEPVYYGADLMVGSLIKNAGGGLAKTGGYIAGKAECVEKCSYRLTCPGIGRESAATGGYLADFIQGFFMAPHTVAQALKTAVYCAYIFEELGYKVNPLPSEERYDIIQTIIFNDPQKLIGFCKGIQAGSPIDSFAMPEPYAMPGYNDEVIMAAGAFVQGASIELSADGPIRPPYIAFMQGGLTFESGRLGILCAVEKILGTDI
ncbi:MAG: methionine gamma-lyase family protein [Clostridia bacterium]|nr:methionine gamma-lyase family protein [Clostridia bacterium]